MNVIPSQYSNYSMSVYVSTLCTLYRPSTVSSHFPLMFLPYAYHTVPVQSFLTVRWYFYLMHTKPSLYSNFPLSIPLSTLFKSYRPCIVTSHCPLMFLPIARHFVPYINISLSVVPSTLYAPRSHCTVSSYRQLIFLTYAQLTVPI
jgi:hypothetical protein